MKVVLRDFEEKDLKVFSKWQTGRHRWMDFDGPYYPKFTKEELEDFVLKLSNLIEQESWTKVRMRLVVANAENDEMIGSVSRYWQSEETNWLSVGIALYEEASWGKGLGYEALGTWCEYLWQEMPELVRLDLRTWSGNKGMMKLAEKLGFKEEARFRKARIVKGEYFDSVGYGVLREEWEDLAFSFPRLILK